MCVRSADIAAQATCIYRTSGALQRYQPHACQPYHPCVSFMFWLGLGVFSCPLRKSASPELGKSTHLRPKHIPVAHWHLFDWIRLQTSIITATTGLFCPHGREWLQSSLCLPSLIAYRPCAPCARHAREWERKWRWRRFVGSVSVTCFGNNCSFSGSPNILNVCLGWGNPLRVGLGTARNPASVVACDFNLSDVIATSQ